MFTTPREKVLPEDRQHLGLRKRVDDQEREDCRSQVTITGGLRKGRPPVRFKTSVKRVSEDNVPFKLPLTRQVSLAVDNAEAGGSGGG